MRILPKNLETMAKQKSQSKKPQGVKRNKKFTQRLFIPNYKYVDIGDEVTKEAVKAWEGWTEVSINNYSK